MWSDFKKSSLIFAMKMLRKCFSASTVLILSLHIMWKISFIFLKRSKISKKEFYYHEEDHFVIYKTAI